MKFNSNICSKSDYFLEFELCDGVVVKSECRAGQVSVCNLFV